MSVIGKFIAGTAIITGICGQILVIYVHHQLQDRDFRLECREKRPWLLEYYYGTLKPNDYTSAIDAQIWNKQGTK